jgi:hypothetical protein
MNPAAPRPADPLARRRGVRGAIEAHLGSPQVTRVVYGAIIGLALLVGIERQPPRAGVVVASLLVTALAVGLAELYSEWVGAETRTRHRVARVEVRHFLVDSVAVGFGIAFPAVFFVLAALDALELQTAFRLAKWTGVGLIAFYGFAAGRLAGASPTASALQGVAVAAIGALVIALKAIVH